jgi:hypothetical protein
MTTQPGLFGESAFPEDSDEPQTPRNFGFWWGLVVNNDDPENRGRIRARVPGLFSNQTTWAEPIGLAGGGNKHGMFAVPKVNAPIVIGFIQGDIDEPFYLAGPQRTGETIDDVHKDNILIQSDNFRIIMDERAGQRVVRIENLRPDLDEETKQIAQSFIEITLNGGDEQTTQAIRIHSAASLALTASVGIEIDAPVVNIKGRLVAVTPKDI